MSRGTAGQPRRAALRRVAQCVALATVTGWGAAGAAPASAAEEIDPVALAAVLLQDGHPDRAQRVLSEADPQAEGVDRPRFFTLLGLATFKQGDHAAALAAFTQAVAAGASDPTVQVYRAQSAYPLGDCATALSALTAAGDAAHAHPDLARLRADCHWQLEQPAEAFAALDAGEARHGAQPDLGRVRLRWLLELKLYRAAAEVGQRLVAEGGGLADERVLAEGLLQGKQFAAARDRLEAARLTFGDDERLLVQLAHAWLGLGHPRTAAGFFARAALLYGPRYSRDAAEVLRQDGQPAAALRHNARVLDQAAKLRQRMGLLLDLERFEALTALAPRLSRLGLLAEDEDLRFALAYGFFRLGQYPAAEAHLRRLTRPALFERAGALRQAMAECARAPERCR